MHIHVICSQTVVQFTVKPPCLYTRTWLHNWHTKHEHIHLYLCLQCTLYDVHLHWSSLLLSYMYKCIAQPDCWVLDVQHLILKTSRTMRKHWRTFSYKIWRCLFAEVCVWTIVTRLLQRLLQSHNVAHRWVSFRFFCLLIIIGMLIV